MVRGKCGCPTVDVPLCVCVSTTISGVGVLLLGVGVLWMSHTSHCGCPTFLWMSHFGQNFFFCGKNKTTKFSFKKTRKNPKKKFAKMWMSHFCVDVPVWVSYTYHHVPRCGTSTPKCGCPTRTTLCGSTSHYPWYIHTTPPWT